MTRPSYKASQRLGRKMANNLLWETPLKACEIGHECKTITLFCVARKIILAGLNFKQQIKCIFFRQGL